MRAFVGLTHAVGLELSACVLTPWRGSSTNGKERSTSWGGKPDSRIKFSQVAKEPEPRISGSRRLNASSNSTHALEMGISLWLLSTRYKGTLYERLSTRSRQRPSPVIWTSPRTTSECDTGIAVCLAWLNELSVGGSS